MLTLKTKGCARNPKAKKSKKSAEFTVLTKAEFYELIAELYSQQKDGDDEVWDDGYNDDFNDAAADIFNSDRRAQWASW